MIWLALIVSVEVCGFWFARRRGAYCLQLFAVVNLILVNTLGGKFADFGGGTVNNVASLFYASVFLAQYVLLAEHPAVAETTVGVSCFALVLVFLLSGFLSQVPVVEGNEAFSAAVTYISATRLRTIAASFIAFYLAMQVLAIGYRGTGGVPHLLRYVLLCALGQLADSICFYPIAFGKSGNWFGLTVGGYAIKMAYAVLTAGLMLLIKTEDKPEVEN